MEEHEKKNSEPQHKEVSSEPKDDKVNREHDSIQQEEEDKTAITEDVTNGATLEEALQETSTDKEETADTAEIKEESQVEAETDTTTTEEPVSAAEKTEEEPLNEEEAATDSTVKKSDTAEDKKDAESTEEVEAETGTEKTTTTEEPVSTAIETEEQPVNEEEAATDSSVAQSGTGESKKDTEIAEEVDAETDTEKTTTEEPVSTAIEAEEQPVIEKETESTEEVEVEAKSIDAENTAESARSEKDVPATEGETESQKEESHDDDEHHEHVLDYHGYSKKQLVQVVESLLKADNLAQMGKVLKEVKIAFDELYEAEKKEALQAFIDDGNEEDDFEYRNLDLDNRFFDAYNQLRDKRNTFYKQKEVEKESNLHKKQVLLEKLREIVDADETTGSINDIKKLQSEWKEIGPVSSQHNKSLWANYNALMDRYYDNRSIYYELKELDRKKNLSAKLEICEKAEALEGEENIKEAIKQLNELHDEFKHIGPVPREDQEAVWKRFKTASDQIYAKRKDYFNQLKKDFSLNLVAKQGLVEKIKPYAEFSSDRITDWNGKTKEVLEIQKEWEAIGGLPKDQAKKVNKDFWSAFKSFFNNKGHFFRELEKQRAVNLEKKKELVVKAKELQDSEDFIKTAEELKSLQREWKEIGPVPEKVRNEVYAEFKEACDHFFNRKRASSSEIEGEYEENLKKKEAICADIDKMTEEGKVEVDAIWDKLDEFSGIGFVPKRAIKSIQKQLMNSVEKALVIAQVDESEKHKIMFSAQYSKIRKGPNSERIIQKKENALRRQISKLEGDIDLWKNNLSFFANSKNADKLKDEFNQKIAAAEKQLHNLKDQLKAISDI